ncbi:helix-turn-helix domain-containing protein [Mameliella alba]|nr:helix-turn-helix domain-containing protein [Antarctobacter heliothermus]MBY6142459.1 helix-turn-helix domain-containing protein [Mameliella alba]MCA0953816.1 helix-turn-helix domain-containing protein [Mameliella alba]
MEKNDAIETLSALAHDIRIDVFRLLIRAGAEGASAGQIAETLEIRPNTLSNNLNILSAAGMIRSIREGRSIRYFANMDGMRDLLSFLMEDCCGGRADLCRPLLDQITCGPLTSQSPARDK